VGKIDIEIFGIKELDELFNELQRSSKRSIFISAFRKAAKPIIQSAKSNLSGSQFKKIRKSLGVKPERYKPILKMGARRWGNFKGNLAHIFNDSTKERRYISVRKFVHKTGRIKGNSFWDRSIDSNKDKVENTIEHQVFESFERYIVRANQRRKTKS